MQGLVYMVDGVEQISLNPIFFPAWFLLHGALCYRSEGQYLSYWRVWGIFREDFYAHILKFLFDWLDKWISVACPPVKGYIKSKSKGITYKSMLIFYSLKTQN